MANPTRTQLQAVDSRQRLYFLTVLWWQDCLAVPGRGYHQPRDHPRTIMPDCDSKESARRCTVSCQGSRPAVLGSCNIDRFEGGRGVTMYLILGDAPPAARSTAGRP